MSANIFSNTELIVDNKPKCERTWVYDGTFELVSRGLTTFAVRGKVPSRHSRDTCAHAHFRAFYKNQKATLTISVPDIPHKNEYQFMYRHPQKQVGAFTPVLSSPSRR